MLAVQVLRPASDIWLKAASGWLAAHMRGSPAMLSMGSGESTFERGSFLKKCPT